MFAEPTMMGVVPGSGGADEKKEAFKCGQTHHRLMIQSSFKIELEKRILIDPPLPILQCLMSTISFAQNHSSLSKISFGNTFGVVLRILSVGES